MKQQSDENNIPKHWQVKKLGEVCDKISINKIKIKQKDYLSVGEFPVIDQGQDLIGGYYNDESLLVPSEPPYIIFGDHTKVKKFVNFRFVPGADGVKVIKPHSSFDPKFFFYLIHTVKIPDKGYARHFQFLEKEGIPIPPLPEQLAIVSKTEELLSDLENGKQQLLTAQQQLKVYRQSLLKAAFEGKLTSTVPSTSLMEQLSEQGSSSSSLSEAELKAEMKEVKLPEGWKWKNLGDFISKIEAGKSFKCDERPPLANEVGVLKVSAVTWGVYNEQESKTIIEKERYNEAYIVKDGDFLFSRANTLDLIGAAVVVGKTSKQLMLSDKTLRFVFNNQIDKYYALYYLRSKKGRHEIQRLSTGNQESMRNIGQARINQIEIPIPPTLREQHQIVEILESKLTVCDKIEETISQSLLQAEALKQSILKKAFEGRLVKPQPTKAIAKPKNEYFYQMQLLALIAKASKQHSIEHGEMTLAKYAYLLDKVYGIPTYYDYNRWHLGPYPPEMKKAINNKQYFSRKANHIIVVNEDKLLNYSNSYETDVIDAVNDLASIFEKYSVKERADKTELLATVSKVVEDIKTSDITEVRKSMQDWKIELHNCPFKNKAEKFSIEETEKCLKFLVQRGWIAKLINKN